MARKSRKRNRNASRPSSEPVREPDQAIAEPSSSPLPTLFEQAPSEPAPSDPVMQAISANTALIQELLDQVNGHRESREEVEELGFSSQDLDSGLDNDLRQTQLEDEVAELTHRNEELVREVQVRGQRIEELGQQTDDLAAQIASSNVRQTVATDDSSCRDALSWDQRKQLILEQMEQDTFNADEFIESIQSDLENVQASSSQESQPADETRSPHEIIQQLFAKLTQCEGQLEERVIEIGELRLLLEQQSETRDGGIAIGAAAIAQMVDSDELVSQERERLQLLQDQWEEKFRKSEIEASLERAKLSRERQQLAMKTEEIEEKLEHLRRDTEQKIDPSESGTSRRWLAKLGLSDAD